MNGHARFAELLARRSELSRPEEDRLEEHLHSCVECRRTATVYARQTTLLRSLPLADPPTGFREEVLAQALRSRPAAMSWRSRPAFLFAPLAAALVVAVAALVYLNRP